MCVGTGKSNIKRYEALGEELRANPLYTPIVITDEMMGVDPKAVSLLRREARRSYLENLYFTDMALKLHTFRRGGPHPSVHHAWRIPAKPEEKQDDAADAAALARAAAAAPEVATRTMLRQWYERWMPYVGKGGHAVIRRMISELTGMEIEAINAKQKCVDERCVVWMADNDASPDTFFDLRAMNGPDGDKFESFWQAVMEVIEKDGVGAEERRTAISAEEEEAGEATTYASKIISIPVLIRDATAHLHAKEGHEKDPIPNEETVRLQFSPNRCPAHPLPPLDPHPAHPSTPHPGEGRRRSPRQSTPAG